MAITGGTGALGLIVAKWLASNGVARIVLLSRSGSVSAANEPLLTALNAAAEEAGVAIEIARLDVSDRGAVETFVVQRAAQLTRGGIIHCAGVLRDSMLSKQSWGTFEEVLAPKAWGALFLHNALRRHNVELMMFVVFSSVTSLMGNLGQTSYGAANAALDALCAARAALNLPALAVQWGPWANFGMAATLERHLKMIWTPLGAEDGLAGLEHALDLSRKATPTTGCVVAVTRFSPSELSALASKSDFYRRFLEDVVTVAPPAATPAVRRQQQSGGGAVVAAAPRRALASKKTKKHASGEARVAVRMSPTLLPLHFARIILTI